MKTVVRVVKSIARSISYQNKAAPTRPITPATASALPRVLDAPLDLEEALDEAALLEAEAEPEDADFAPLDAADGPAVVVALGELAELTLHRGIRK